jgi:hypothetical protein
MLLCCHDSSDTSLQASDELQAQEPTKREDDTGDTGDTDDTVQLRCDAFEVGTLFFPAVSLTMDRRGPQLIDHCFHPSIEIGICLALDWVPYFALRTLSSYKVLLRVVLLFLVAQ